MRIREREDWLASVLGPRRSRFRYCSSASNYLIYALLFMGLVACVVYKVEQKTNQHHPSSNPASNATLSNTTEDPQEGEGIASLPTLETDDTVSRRRRPVAKPQAEQQPPPLLEIPVNETVASQQEQEIVVVQPLAQAQAQAAVAAVDAEETNETPSSSCEQVCQSTSISDSATTTCGSLIRQFKLEFDLSVERSTQHVSGRHTECQVCLECIA